MKRSDQSTAAPAAKASRRRYVDVAQAVLTAVAQGEFAAGDRLPPDRDLAVRCQVSRPTAREALLVLELIGAVEIRHGDGVYVRGNRAQVGGIEGSPLDAPPRELIESRRMLEPGVAAMAARRIGREALLKIRRDVDEASSLVGNLAEISHFMELGFRFHSDVAAGCGNSLLSGVVGQLVDIERHPLWMLINQQAMSAVEARGDQMRDHQEILAALEAGDGDRAEALMSAHLGGLETRIFVPAGDAALQPGRAAAQA